MLDVQNLTVLPASITLLKLKICHAVTYCMELIRRALAENYKNKVESATAAF
jgi:hypothetical protein